MREEVDFILEAAGSYLQKVPTRADVLSVFAGIRPLVNSGAVRSTAALARDHIIKIENPGLLTIAGGKWTTYRSMAEDCIDQAAALASLSERPCITASLPLHGFEDNLEKNDDFSAYGSDRSAILELIRQNASLSERLHPDLRYRAAEVVWAARFEMARTIEDVLARRTRALFLNAKAASQMAPQVAELMVRELQLDEAWQRQQVKEFQELALGYMVE